MSREIDLENGYEGLSQDDLYYLFQRDQLPEPYLSKMIKRVQSAGGGMPDEGGSPQSKKAERVQPESDEQVPDSFQEMSRKDLLEEMDSRGIVAPKTATKQVLVDLLEAFDAGELDDEEEPEDYEENAEPDSEDSVV